MALRDELRQALDRNEFEVHYQPIVDARSGRITAAEALLRWHHPQRGLLSPATFITVAEQVADKRYRPLGAAAGIAPAAALWQARVDARSRCTSTYRHIQLKQDGFVDEVRSLLAEAACPPGCSTWR